MEVFCLAVLGKVEELCSKVRTRYPKENQIKHQPKLTIKTQRNRPYTEKSSSTIYAFFKEQYFFFLHFLEDQYLYVRKLAHQVQNLRDHSFV